MKKRIITAALLVIASFLLDKYAAEAAASIQIPLLAQLASLISVIAVAATLVIPAAILLIRKDNKKLPAMYAAIIASFALSYLLKFIFAVERPSGNKKIAFTNLNDYSFPSTHSTVAFSPLYLIEKETFWGKAWAIFATLVAASRIYLGLHNLSDTVVGAVIGYLAGMYFSKNSRFEIRKDFFEVKRQAFHLGLGLATAFLIYKNLLNAASLLAIIAAGIILSLISKKAEIPLISWFLDNFERREDRRGFPGRGAIFLMAGSLIAVILFPRDAALASIMILALGDSFSHVVGKFFGRTRHPFSVKLIEGTAFGIVMGFLGAVVFVSVTEALIAAAVSMSLEAVEIRLHKYVLDDNLLIPLAAGASIVLLRLVT
ncbi:phosphatase PAP2 family protein [Candidatus Woesearchaeota archaeon]|nr:phosphatase PAP2 family protein [Candidatus Woesearchaeota archaeon]